MKNIDEIKYLFFLGIGGIGMSALARFFNQHNFIIAGYDKTPSPLTDKLINEGINIHFEDDTDNIPNNFKNKDNCTVVYTPAIPDENQEMQFFRQNGFEIVKRAEMLGKLSEKYSTLAVAGTHGKTTISSMLAHIMQFHKEKCHAFVGGITVNYNSNYIDAGNSNNMVVEADEFDRSFLHLKPESAIITHVDADHLDIYGEKSKLEETFFQFASQVENNLITHIDTGVKSVPGSLTYSLDNKAADFHAADIKSKNGFYHFDLQTPERLIKNIQLNIPGKLNLENIIAASSLAVIKGISEEQLKEAVKSFKGIKRRFEIICNNEDFHFIDDYAHHPTELTATISSLRSVFPEKKITGVFQPHLYSRTRDFAAGFAESLDKLDKCILLPIYPAREKPIEGVESDIIFDKMMSKNKTLINKTELIDYLKNENLEVLVTLGAGDIDRLVAPIKETFCDE